jgi:hypothetical protein
VKVELSWARVTIGQFRRLALRTFYAISIDLLRDFHMKVSQTRDSGLGCRTQVLNLHARNDNTVPPGGGQSSDGWFFDSVGPGPPGP